MACFADINVSQGSVAAYARCGGIFNTYLAANLHRNRTAIFLYRLASLNLTATKFTGCGKGISRKIFWCFLSNGLSRHYEILQIY